MRDYVVTATAVVGVFAAVSAQAATEVRYGLWAKPGEAQYIAADKFKQMLEADSKGAFKVTLYPGDVLGTEAEQAEQLALGTTQVFASGWAGIKQIEYLALPYLMSNLKNYVSVIESPIGQQWNDELAGKSKVRIVGFLSRSPRQITANRPINSMADLKGLKMRVPELDYYVKSFVAFGARPTPMAFGEVYTALQAGTVDGQENPIETIYAQKFHEVQKSIAIVDYIKKPAYVMVGMPFWSKLKPEEQALVLKAQRASEAVVEELLPKQQEELLQKMKQGGIQVTYPDRVPFIQATQAVRDELGIKAWGEKLYREIVAIGQKTM
ncbi:MAG: TRAP transporter substrate-binding protein [Proteobacteria bacterium]|nr:TRAP transporter substrate-binding protein [Pseudomonadota bacterium]